MFQVNGTPVGSQSRKVHSWEWERMKGEVTEELMVEHNFEIQIMPENINGENGGRRWGF